MISGILNLLNTASNQLGKPSDNDIIKKVRPQLFQCTYHNNIKFVLEKICFEIIREYPKFETQILEFIQNNQPRRFIEVGGFMTYIYKGKKHVFKVYMMFNQFFPNKSPYVRVVNTENVPVNEEYDLCQSPNDPKSYVLNKKLNNIATWAPGRSCLPIFAELEYLFQNKPFYATAEQAPKSAMKKTGGIFGLLTEKRRVENPKEIPKQQQYTANRGSYYQQTELKTKQVLNQEKNQEQNYDSRQCKICYNSQSSMINVSCGHIMMCEKCFRDYRKKCGSDICPCPICNTKGQYIKFVEPKFA